MNQIQQNNLSDFADQVSFPVHCEIYGHVIRCEERDGSHLLKCINIHPGGGDTLKATLVDVAAYLRYRVINLKAPLQYYVKVKAKPGKLLLGGRKELNSCLFESMDLAEGFAAAIMEQENAESFEIVKK